MLNILSFDDNSVNDRDTRGLYTDSCNGYGSVTANCNVSVETMDMSCYYYHVILHNIYFSKQSGEDFRWEKIHIAGVLRLSLKTSWLIE